MKTSVPNAVRYFGTISDLSFRTMAEYFIIRSDALNADAIGTEVLRMSDLIDKQSVVDIAMCYCPDDDGSCSKADADIRELLDEIENLQAVNRWIPCSERLPENGAEVLVWFEYFRYGEYNRLYQTYGIGEYFENYDSWLIDHETGWQKLRVIAWMPLPEPPEKE